MMTTQLCDHGYDTPAGCPMCRRASIVEREQGELNARIHANGLWFHMAELTVKRLAVERSVLTADDVLHELNKTAFRTGDNRALGPVMKLAAANGWIRSTNQFQESTNKKKHQSPTRIWESLIFDGRLF